MSYIVSISRGTFSSKCFVYKNTDGKEGGAHLAIPFGWVSGIYTRLIVSISDLECFHLSWSQGVQVWLSVELL